MMNYFKVFICLFFTSLSIVSYGEVEKRTYDITAAGIRIGEMVATRETKDNVTFYSLHSKVSFWFFVRVQVDYAVTSMYKGNHLISSTVITNSSKGNFKSTVQWSEDHYDVKVNGYKYTNNTSIKDSIEYNSARFYFEYPPGISTILADNYGIMVPADNIENNVYTVNVQGDKNRFFFKGGKIIRAIMHHPIKNFEVKLKS
jgi:hypothetical protein